MRSPGGHRGGGGGGGRTLQAHRDRPAGGPATPRDRSGLTASDLYLRAYRKKMDCGIGGPAIPEALFSWEAGAILLFAIITNL